MDRGKGGSGVEFLTSIGRKGMNVETPILDLIDFILVLTSLKLESRLRMVE